MLSKQPPYTGISLMLEQDVFHAAKPFLENGDIEILEWSFDMGWGDDPLPSWCSSLLNQYSQANRLTGHGVSFSILSGEWTQRQEWWLESLKKEVQERNYLHISEHFGFMSAGNFHRSAPLPVPLTAPTLALGQSRLKQLSEICKVPIGLENLAFAFGLEDVKRQGAFLRQLIEPVDGFLVLDLHNIYCQLCNFQIDPQALLESYPLDRVREMHVSGGSWSSPPSAKGKEIRRDTHDNAVPVEVFKLVELALPQCPHVEAVIFERLGNTLLNDAEIEQYRHDFRYLKQLVSRTYA